MLGKIDIAISNHPLTAEFRQEFEARYGPARQLTMGELRQVPLISMLRMLRALHANNLWVVVDDENSRILLGPLKILACVATARKRTIVSADLSSQHLSRSEGLHAVWQLLTASLKSVFTVVKAKRRIASLLKLPRIEVECSNANSVLYLNTNLWFGLKAGGSVGHIAGVANGLIKAGFQVDFATAGGRQMVSESAELIPLLPPSSFGIPYEANYYEFSDDVAAILTPHLMAKKHGFIYQRMSLANTSGVELSRKLCIPLVIEYNGSEAWASKNWGNPLTFHDLACQAENVCFRHAHAVVTISDVLREELIERGVSRDRIVMYPNCIDPDMFDPQQNRKTSEEIRQSYGLDATNVVAGFVGTFGQWHGIDVLARAIRILADEHMDWVREHRLHFLVVGDGQKMPDILRIFEGSRAKEICTLTGLIPQRQAPFYLGAMDILLSPHVPNSDGTNFFGSPTKLFEYMAMGKAIVASDLDQIGEVLHDSLHADSLPTYGPNDHETVISVLTKPGDVNELITGLRFCVERPEWRSILGKNARAEALAKYTWQHHVAAIMERLKYLELIRD